MYSVNMLTSKHIQMEWEASKSKLSFYFQNYQYTTNQLKGRQNSKDTQAIKNQHTHKRDKNHSYENNKVKKFTSKEADLNSKT